MCRPTEVLVRGGARFAIFDALSHQFGSASAFGGVANRGKVGLSIENLQNDLNSRTVPMNQPPNYFKPVTLVGKRVRLEHLSKDHIEHLSAAGAHEEVWRWLPTAHHAPGSMASFIDTAINQYDQFFAVPFATVDVLQSRAVGSTRFHCIEPTQRRLEIGVTWISPDYQRSHVNTEAKFLQLWYAFEILECRRVEFKADAENLKSRKAILRLGAKEEGYFRKHMIYPDGRNRDSIYFSILDDEWPIGKKGLLDRLGYDVMPSVLNKDLLEESVADQ
jgi:RimJ/RimL family protein N-acetyltransferase